MGPEGRADRRELSWALVTGAASGIGLGVAEEFALRGLSVVLSDRRPGPLAAAADRVRRLAGGGRVETGELDVTDRNAFAALVDRVEAEIGPVDVLVYNAGVGYTNTPLYEIPDRDIDWVIDVNIKGVLNGLTTVVPRKVARGRGHVVNMSSMSGLALPPGIHHGLYGATKAAVIMLSEGLREDLEGSGVHVSVVCPGFVRTQLPWSGRYRGAAYGGPVERRVSESVLAAMQRGLDPRTVGRLVARAIDLRLFFVLTDLEEADDLRRWHALIEAAMQDMAASGPAEDRAPAT